MKTIKANLKVATLFFSILIMLQSCTVYQTANVTLDEAVISDNKVRIEKKNGAKLKYSKVVKFNDGKYYGKLKEKGFFINVLIDEDNIAKVQLKDQKTSTIFSVVIPLIIIGSLIGIIAWQLENMVLY
jgi:hypothetical protein